FLGGQWIGSVAIVLLIYLRRKLRLQGIHLRLVLRVEITFDISIIQCLNLVFSAYNLLVKARDRALHILAVAGLETTVDIAQCSGVSSNILLCHSSSGGYISDTGIIISCLLFHIQHLVVDLIILQILHACKQNVVLFL